MAPRSIERAAIRKIAIFCVWLAVFSACSLNTAKKQYVLAEKLWTDGKYAAAVTEFEKVYARDRQGSLGKQALYRAATTQAYFLSQYSEAVKKLRTYAELNASDAEASWDALVQIGEILYSKMELYDEAIRHYQELVKKRPKDPDAPSFLFRIGKSQFFLWKFEEANRTYFDLIKRFPTSPWAERAAYEVGVTYYTRGEQEQGHGSESYQDAIDAFERFLKRYPKSEWVPQAQFGIAGCLEEMDQLDAAYHAYEALRTTYPSPKVIAIKLARIRERKAQRSR